MKNDSFGHFKLFRSTKFSSHVSLFLISKNMPRTAITHSVKVFQINLSGFGQRKIYSFVKERERESFKSQSKVLYLNRVCMNGRQKENARWVKSFLLG